MSRSYKNKTTLIPFDMTEKAVRKHTKTVPRRKNHGAIDRTLRKSRHQRQREKTRTVKLPFFDIPEKWFGFSLFFFFFEKWWRKKKGGNLFFCGVKSRLDNSKHLKRKRKQNKTKKREKKFWFFWRIACAKKEKEKNKEKKEKKY